MCGEVLSLEIPERKMVDYYKKIIEAVGSNNDNQGKVKKNRGKATNIFGFRCCVTSGEKSLIKQVTASFCQQTLYCTP